MCEKTELGELRKGVHGLETFTELGWIPIVVTEGEITPDQFRAATGHDPIDDDLERCNCPDAGELGHQSCGWNHEQNCPQFMARSE